MGDHGVLSARQQKRFSFHRAGGQAGGREGGAGIKELLCCGALIIMVSILEWGPSKLQLEAAWLPVAVIRSSISNKQVEGGFSACAKALLRRWFVAEPRLQSDGVLMKCGPGNTPALLFLTFGCTLSDEAALKAFWSSKGASAISPCWKCWVTNFLKGESLVEYDATKMLRDIRCGRGEFDLVSDGDRHIQADVLTNCKAKVTAEKFDMLEKAYGLNYTPQGVLWDLDLREIVLPQSGSRYDAVHCFLCGGIVNEEVDFLLERMHDLSPPITFELLNTYFDAAWCAAQVFNGRLDKRMACDVFSKQRETYFKNEGKFRPNASQMLFVVPVLAHFMQTVADVRMKLPEETASLAALSEVGSQTAEAVHASHKPCWAGVVEH